ncbi:hypothetical protein [Thalassomonas actiniarum]|uniref:Lipoprotein n=1 Tax=Thalassomonas actiniarum TaxID=485447 RepID=A0AAE9YQ07_9GAMM|nr:hypothetical protein [Thalassomonas actiniarum]WDD98159.1 hypothetical protein SG35_023225 [Thalassomonas actiniarum]
MKLALPFSLITSALLSACGGSSGSDSSPETGKATVASNYALTGKVIDGYVSGATVWLDFNGNGILDANEPSAISSDAGSYTMELTGQQRQCAAYSAIYVDVPVGAIDETEGEVTEAYQMMRPPQLETLTDSSLLHISPLTTVLWESLKKDLTESSIENCSAFLNDQEKRQQIKSRLSESIYNTVSHYNISAEKIFSDFIAANDETSQQLAVNIVKNLKKSYGYRQQLTEQYADTSEIRVVYYQGESYDTAADIDAWYRKVVIFFNNDNFLSRVDRVTEDLSDIIRPIYYRDEVVSPWKSGTLSLTKDIISRGYDGDLYYSCSLSEKIEITAQGTRYTLTNGGQGGRVDNIEQCQPDTVNPDGYRGYGFDYQQGGKYYFSDLRQSNYDNGISYLTDWVNFTENEDSLDPQEMISEMSAMGYKFDEEVNGEFSSWYKRHTTYSGNSQTQITKSSGGSWEKIVYASDGTHTRECSRDGETWLSCDGF